MVSVEDTTLRGGGRALKKAVWDSARETIEEWTGEELTECSLYGIRIYGEGSVLATHVDRLPLVSSAIINVAQDLDEPWPLEVYGHDGKATNVTMEPGEMVLYESASVLHGRPFPLKGRFFANIFIHFEPVGHSLRHNTKTDAGGDVHKKYKDALNRGVGGHEVEQTGLPPYIVPGTPEEAHWRQAHPGGFKSKRNSATTGSLQTVAHLASQSGNLQQLQWEVKANKDLVKAKDENGWTPLHEGARGGYLDVVKYLVENGAELNEQTGNGSGGGTALYYAKQNQGPDHEVVSFLESIGALNVGPDL
jgi:prolyl 4-hydroxylase